MDYKIIDNFLTKEQNKLIEKTLSANTFPWYYVDGIIENDDHYHLNHSFMLAGKVNSDYFSIIEPLLKKIKYKNILRIRSNLTLKHVKKITYSKHRDDHVPHKVLLYYVNTTNAGTFLENKKIQCKKNRAVIFNGNIWHSPIAQTDTKTRIVINVTYQI